MINYITLQLKNDDTLTLLYFFKEHFNEFSSYFSQIFHMKFSMVENMISICLPTSEGLSKQCAHNCDSLDVFTTLIAET